MCVFSRRNDTGRIIALAIIHVDDVLVGAIPSEIRRFNDMMDKSFKHGGFNIVANNSSIVFCGLQILCSNHGVLGLSQDTYRGNIPRYTTQDFFGAHASNKKRIHVETDLRKLVGPALRLAQTRFDIGFLAIRLSTLLVSACQNASDLHLFLKTADQLYRVLDEHAVTIWYHAFDHERTADSYPWDR